MTDANNELEMLQLSNAALRSEKAILMSQLRSAQARMQDDQIELQRVKAQLASALRDLDAARRKVAELRKLDGDA